MSFLGDHRATLSGLQPPRQGRPPPPHTHTWAREVGEGLKDPRTWGEPVPPWTLPPSLSVSCPVSVCPHSESPPHTPVCLSSPSVSALAGRAPSALGTVQAAAGPCGLGVDRLLAKSLSAGSRPTASLPSVTRLPSAQPPGGHHAPLTHSPNRDSSVSPLRPEEPASGTLRGPANVRSLTPPGLINPTQRGTGWCV